MATPKKPKTQPLPRLEKPVTVVGHPFSTTGMGEQFRAGLAALRAAGINPGIFDVYRYAPRTDVAHLELVGSDEASDLPHGGLRVFHLNGNEVEPAFAHLKSRGIDVEKGTNVVVPAWELPRYPKVWAKELSRFKEVWALSRYTQRIFEDAGLNVQYVGQSIQVPHNCFYPRRHFGIRESAFTLLQFFDTTSFVDRKNPFATIDLYHRLRNARPYADIQLVLKVKHGDEANAQWEAELKRAVPDALIVSGRLETRELHSLISACDCFVSLHRAEGFGRGTGEAMSLGRLALATAWSGNLDYMSSDNSLLVKYRLIDVKKDQYPHWQKQKWADPDIGHALDLLLPVIDDPDRASEMKRAGRRTVENTMSHRAVGVRMAARLRALSN